LKAIYDLLIIAGVCVTLLIASEIGSRLVLRVLATNTSQETTDPRSQLPAYADSPYDAATYWRQFHAAKHEVYYPYIVWRQQSSSASLINIDDQGNRKTHYNSGDPAALQVWMMGGSTMWGMGTPDAHTIPSAVAKILNDERGIAARVRNLGEIGFVSTQELTQLVRELQTGRRPDIVIFLDGVNDAPAAALWPDVPGSHMNLYSIRSRFEHHDPHESAMLALIKTTGLHHLAGYIAARLMPKGMDQGNWTTPASPQITISEGNQAADIWMSNIRMIRALGRSFGFKPYFFLQPSLLVGEKTRSASERRLAEKEKKNPAKKAGMAVYAEMRRAVRGILADKPIPGVFDQTDLFRNVDDSLYVDYVHIADRGNELIARDIVTTVIEQYCADLTGGRNTAPDSGTPCRR